MTRKRRELATAGTLRVGDLITAPNGYRANVDYLGTSGHVLEPHVVVHWVHCDDTSVPEHTRGSASGRTYRPGDAVTRWITTNTPRKNS
jgi:hypothetical protein